MWRRRPEDWRERATNSVVVLAALLIADVSTDWFGDGVVLIACVVIGAAGLAWLAYDRHGRTDAKTTRS